MKISKRQLKKMIQEEMAHPRGDLGKNIADADFPIVVGYELNGQPQSEIAYNQDELDEILDYLAPLSARGRDIPYSLNSLDEKEPGSHPIGSGIEQFAEGRRSLLEYSEYPSYGDFADFMDDITDMIEEAAMKYSGSGWLKDGDHSFKPRKTSGISESENWDSAIKVIIKFLKISYRKSPFV